MEGRGEAEAGMKEVWSSRLLLVSWIGAMMIGRQGRSEVLEQTARER